MDNHEQVIRATYELHELSLLEVSDDVLARIRQKLSTITELIKDMSLQHAS